MHGFEFGAQSEGVSFGRHVDSIGREHFVAQITNTFGAPNAAPRIPPVIISEIMYHPLDVVTNGLAWNNTEDEYVELHNRADQLITLSRTNGETWSITGTIDYVFPANTTLPARGHVLLASFDPVANPALADAFRLRHNTPPGAIILGPYSGQLDNQGGRIALWQPDASAPPGTLAPSVLAEEIVYDDNHPWPAGADGFRFSLNRVSVDSFGDDPGNWRAARPTPAAPLTPGGAALPEIARHPASATLTASLPLTLSVAVSGSGSFRYQWRWNGDDIPGATNSIHSIISAQPAQSGQYSVVVFNSAGAVVSNPATILIGADSDSDRMLDAWEIAFGTDLFNAADAAADPDGDLMSSYQEYLAGTNPNDFQSALRVLRVTVAGGATISFQALANRSYTMQFSESLTAPQWSALATVSARPEGFIATVTDSNSSTNRYYRIVTPAAP